MNKATTTMALLASLTFTACLTAPDEADEAYAESELATGETALYKCAYPMCSGVAITFDSRDLSLQSCTYDSRAGAVDCDAGPASSPAMPTAFWASDWELSCSDGRPFHCEGTKAAMSCVCTTTATATATTGRRTYQPLVIRKRIDKS